MRKTQCITNMSKLLINNNTQHFISSNNNIRQKKFFFKKSKLYKLQLKNIKITKLTVNKETKVQYCCNVETSKR